MGAEVKGLTQHVSLPSHVSQPGTCFRGVGLNLVIKLTLVLIVKRNVTYYHISSTVRRGEDSGRLTAVWEACWKALHGRLLSGQVKGGVGFCRRHRHLGVPGDVAWIPSQGVN
ncbi:hypothetical protein E2C01_047521 [Portunus trituberculatus]|uniref:Uncharacterized protein n=1 Tax=Portunus trituberculatus TaxID=210409 RepID=A0A5B7G0U6_PORTR|nr:hypothetical protein [Portunus trituberculatus]